jgi:carbamoyl-phosphate synthase large subunit
VEEALAIVEKIGDPVLVHPSFVLGGRGMVIVYKEKYLRKFVEEAAAIGEGKPILIDRFLEDATELDVDCTSDGKHTVVAGGYGMGSKENECVFFFCKLMNCIFGANKYKL